MEPIFGGCHFLDPLGVGAMLCIHRGLYLTAEFEGVSGLGLLASKFGGLRFGGGSVGFWSGVQGLAFSGLVQGKALITYAYSIL